MKDVRNAFETRKKKQIKIYTFFYKQSKNCLGFSKKPP